MTNEELIQLYKAGDEEAFEKLLQQNQGILKKLVFKNRTKYSVEDAMQDAVMGMLEAAKRWDPARNVKFITYAYPWINKYIVDGTPEGHDWVNKAIKKIYAQNEHLPLEEIYLLAKDKCPNKALTWATFIWHITPITHISIVKDKDDQVFDFIENIADARLNQERVDIESDVECLLRQYPRYRPVYEGFKEGLNWAQMAKKQKITTATFYMRANYNKTKKIRNKKQEYNNKYYLKHREKILEKAKYIKSLKSETIL